MAGVLSARPNASGGAAGRLLPFPTSACRFASVRFTFNAASGGPLMRCPDSVDGGLAVKAGYPEDCVSGDTPRSVDNLPATIFANSLAEREFRPATVKTRESSAGRRFAFPGRRPPAPIRDSENFSRRALFGSSESGGGRPPGSAFAPQRLRRAGFAARELRAGRLKAPARHPAELPATPPPHTANRGWRSD